MLADLLDLNYKINSWEKRNQITSPNNQIIFSVKAEGIIVMSLSKFKKHMIYQDRQLKDDLEG